MKALLRILCVIALLVIVSVIYITNHTQVKPQLKTPAVSALPAVEPTPNLDEVYSLVNQERIAAGDHQLTLNPTLSQAATNHCNDMVAQDYWDHVNPQGKTIFNWINDTGLKFQYGGENISEGYPTADTTVTALYNSPEHKANTLNPRFTDLGLAECSAKTYKDIVVEMFTQAV